MAPPKKPLDDRLAHKLTLLLSEDDLRMIDDYWHAHRLRSRNEAIRILVRRGLGLGDDGE